MHFTIDTENNLSFIAIVNDNFVDFQLYLTLTDTWRCIGSIKGPSLLALNDDPRIDPVDFLTLLRRAFAFMRDIPPHTPVLYHLQQLYPEYFI